MGYRGCYHHHTIIIQENREVASGRTLGPWTPHEALYDEANAPADGSDEYMNTRCETLDKKHLVGILQGFGHLSYRLPVRLREKIMCRESGDVVVGKGPFVGSNDFWGVSNTPAIFLFFSVDGFSFFFFFPLQNNKTGIWQLWLTA